MSHTLMRIMRVAIAFFLLILIGFEIVPTSSERDTQQYIVEAGFQRGRSQQIERAAYILQYRPESEKTHAINELQTSLFAFQQEQALLWENSDLDVQRSLHNAQKDYTAIVAAAQALLDHPHSLIELDIILLHTPKFFQVIDDLVIILEQQLANRVTQLLIIRISMLVLCIFMITSLLLPGRRSLMDRKTYTKKEEGDEASRHGSS